MIRMGIPNSFVRWTRAFLFNRQARVRINNHPGRYYSFKQGLPQGSVLSPLLFLVYINDLVTCPLQSTKMSLYADDVAL